MSYLDPVGDDEPDPGGNYLVRHWRGGYGLAIAYWLNGSLLLGGFTLLTAFAVGQLEGSSATLRTVAMVSLAWIVAILLAWLWAVVGIWRSAGRHVGRGGTPFWANAARVMVVLGGLATLGQAPGLVEQAAEFGQLAAGTDPIGPLPEIAADRTGERIEISGPITSGSAELFATVLASAPRARALLLSSDGGRIREAQAMARQIVERRMTTRVEEQCMSACTFLLLAGHERTAAAGARIGFHQPSFPGMAMDGQRLLVESNREDYRRAGVAGWFVERAMAARPESMWFPSQGDLVAANVLTSSEIVVASSEAQQARSLAAQLAQAAREINSRAPRRLDDMTTLERATSEGATLTYAYRIHADRAEIDPAVIRTQLAPQVRTEACRDEAMRQAIEAGATFRYAYADARGRAVHAFSVGDCP